MKNLSVICISIIFLLILSSCSSPYEQVVVSSKENEQSAKMINIQGEDIPTVEEDNPADESDVQIIEADDQIEQEVSASPVPDTEPQEIQPDTGLTPEEENLFREKKAFLLIDTAVITKEQCPDLLDLWDRNLQTAREDLNDASEDIDGYEQDLIDARENYESAKSSGLDASIETARDRLNDAEKELREAEDKVTDLEDLLFKTGYTNDEVNKKCSQLKVS